MWSTELDVISIFCDDFRSNSQADVAWGSCVFWKNGIVKLQFLIFARFDYQLCDDWTFISENQIMSLNSIYFWKPNINNWIADIDKRTFEVGLALEWNRWTVFNLDIEVSYSKTALLTLNWILKADFIAI